MPVKIHFDCGFAAAAAREHLRARWIQIDDVFRRWRTGGLECQIVLRKDADRFLAAYDEYKTKKA